MGEDEITKAARESAEEIRRLEAEQVRVAREWDEWEKAERKRHAEAKTRAGCPFRAGMDWPADRCPESAGPGGCGLWVDRGGWAVGCALFVLGVAVARGLDITAQVLPE